MLLARDALRPADERVPADIIAAYAHRRSLLTADLLRGEGFAAVHDVDDLTDFQVEPSWTEVLPAPGHHTAR
jgi:hypothetical protein